MDECVDKLSFFRYIFACLLKIRVYYWMDSNSQKFVWNLLIEIELCDGSCSLDLYVSLKAI